MQKDLKYECLLCYDMITEYYEPTLYEKIIYKFPIWKTSKTSLLPNFRVSYSFKCFYFQVCKKINLKIFVPYRKTFFRCIKNHSKSLNLQSYNNQQTTVNQKYDFTRNTPTVFRFFKSKEHLIVPSA
jgi:hypothetical protein